MHLVHRSMISRASPICVVNPHKRRICALRVKGLLGCLVAIICHVGSRLNPSDEIAQFGALGQEFTESANTKANNFMRTGLSGTGPVSHNEGSIGPLEPVGVSR